MFKKTPTVICQSEYLKGIEWFVIIKNGCPACIKAKEMLKGQNAKFVEISTLDPEYREKIIHFYAADWKTVPMVFHKGVFIGGSTDIEKYL
jgi:glutaredoxin